LENKKKAEEALRGEHEFSKSLVDTAQAIVLVLDTEGRIVSYNPYMEDISGYRLEDVKGKDWFTTFLPECDYEKIRRLFKKAIGERQTRGNVNPIITKDGHKIFIEWHDKVLKDAKGNITGLLAIGQDVTERKKFEKDLKRTEEKYHSLVDNSSVVIARINPEGNYVLVNNTFLKLTRLPREEVVGHGAEILKPFLNEEHFSKMIEAGTETLAKQTKTKTELCFKDHDGNERWFLQIAYPWYEPDGRLGGAELICDDITERKNAEQALKESEEEFRLLYATSRDALMTLEPPSWRFTSGNPATVEMFRTKDEKEFTSMPPWELSPEYQPDRQLSSAKANTMIEEAMEKGSNFFEWVHRRADGEDFPATVLLTRVKLKGKEFLQATVRDITAQKKAETEREKLHDQAKERLVMIQKQNIQLMALQKRLKQYANKLETKVKKLEESKLDLTDKERLVFYAMVACPDMNDREIAEKTKLKRSTVTAIKNRLKEEKLYQEINMPDLAALGCGLMTAIYGKFDMEYGEIKRMREKVMSADVVFAHTTDTGFFALTATKDLVSFHKNIGPSITFATKAKAFKDYPSIAHFPLELSIIQEFFNFAPMLRESFSMTENFTQKPVQGNPERQPLNKNAKEVLYALVKHPEASTVELAKMLRLTRATVSRIKSDLFRQGLVKKLIVPDIKRLNYAFSMVCHFKQAPGITADAVKRSIQSFRAPGSITHLALLGASESMCGRLFKDGREHAEFMSRLIREMNAEGIITEDPIEYSFPIQETKQFMFSFAPITKKMLGIEKEI
jgi:PAS domain S-box-containing protein